MNGLEELQRSLVELKKSAERLRGTLKTFKEQQSAPKNGIKIREPLFYVYAKGDKEQN